MGGMRDVWVRGDWERHNQIGGITGQMKAIPNGKRFDRVVSP